MVFKPHIDSGPLQKTRVGLYAYISLSRNPYISIYHNLISGPDTVVNRWLAPLANIANEGGYEEDINAAHRRLCQQNIRASIARLARTEVVQSAWARWHDRSLNGQKPLYIHGWMYELRTGLLSDLGISIGPEEGWNNKYFIANLETGMDLRDERAI